MRLIIAFIVLSILTGSLAFSGLVVAFAGIAKVLFILCLIGLAVSVVKTLMYGPKKHN